MPRKRKSNISQYSKKARAMRIIRRNETSQQAELRRLEQAARDAARRAAETPEETQNRRQKHAEYMAYRRAAEKSHLVDDIWSIWRLAEALRRYHNST
ncbi:unnamed protein product [Euphydryas editha]|uniref:Uncharacterized protein n=1 Tax=Euphydryas editha TaxID=104508 RepID=A0AAU9UTS2_EUPED|nr:unnamed protein product [Euphydryas editha]